MDATQLNPETDVYILNETSIIHFLNTVPKDKLFHGATYNASCGCNYEVVYAMRSHKSTWNWPKPELVGIRDPKALYCERCNPNSTPPKVEIVKFSELVISQTD